MPLIMSRYIAVDIDEVLVPFFPELSKYHQKKIKKTLKLPLRYPYHYAPLFKISEKESSKLVKEFYNSEEHSNIQPIYGAKDGISQLARDYIMVAVTGRQNYSKDATEALITKHFDNKITDIIYCDHFTAFSRSKSDICRKLGAEYLIDDSMHSCAECLSDNVPAINFIGNPIYPWCETSSIAARDWGDVLNNIS